GQGWCPPWPNRRSLSRGIWRNPVQHHQPPSLPPWVARLHSPMAHRPRLCSPRQGREEQMTPLLDAPPPIALLDQHIVVMSEAGERRAVANLEVAAVEARPRAVLALQLHFDRAHLVPQR